MFETRFDSLPESPFPRLAALLEGIEPGGPPVVMSIGEPAHPIPGFVRDILAQHNADFSRYPPALGTESLRQAIAIWIARRYGCGSLVDPDKHILPVCGSREALFTIALLAVAESRGPDRPAALMPNPFYQTYATAAVAAGAEPVMLAATRDTGHLPDLGAISEELFDRTAIFYLCSPANPQGAVADLDYFAEAIRLARTHRFLLVADECYSEVYASTPPPGVVEAADRIGDGLSNVVFLNSLSKRSNLAGLRSGFCAGDAEFMASFLKFRNLASPQLPLPVQAASAAAWSDESHVDASRALYQEKYRLAARILDDRFNFEPPRAGMFLWLDVSGHGGGEAATRTLWRETGVKVLPGGYLANDMPDGSNPGSDYIRVALVKDAETTRRALEQMVAVL